MRRLAAYILLLLATVSCAVDIDRSSPVEGDGDSLEGKPVVISFSVPDVRVAASTKGLDDGEGDITAEPYLDPDKFFLIVCGGSQSIKYVRKAELVKDPMTGLPQTTTVPVSSIPGYPITDPAGVTEVELYTFKVQLELSDTPRTIHFLGNVDESQLVTGSYSYQVLPYLLSGEWKQAYWQKVEMPYIKAREDKQTDPATGSYLPDDATSGKLQYVPLIRNFAEIRLTNVGVDNFELQSYAVIYYPKHGTVAPYRFNFPDRHPEQGFSFITTESDYGFSGYEKRSFNDLDVVLDYPGNLPAGVAFDRAIPTATMFENPALSGGRVKEYDENNPGTGFFVYERGIPTATLDPTFIIIRGRMKSSDDPSYHYYRLDLMESDASGNVQYYPIYRNFRYDIQLHRVSSAGVSDPESAANSSGAEDISADVSMQHLSDISNGHSRLVVEPYMMRTVTGPNVEDGYYEIYARFFNDASSDNPNTNATAVQVLLEPVEEGGEDILVLYNDNMTPVTAFYPRAQTIDGIPGFRVIRFNTKAPGSQKKTQKIKITGWNDQYPELYPLYREVEITLQEKQLMEVSCSSHLLSLSRGLPQTVGITIPAGLPESMFPLEFTVEAQDMTLTPVSGTDPGNNLPVVSGTSISTDEGYAGKKAFQFIRTLTHDEYRSLSVENGKCTFYCYFKTNRSRSATKVWVENEYFYTDCDEFFNEGYKFTNFKFLTSIPRQAGGDVTVHFELIEEESGVFPEITLTATGMTKDGAESFTYTPTADSQDIVFQTTSYDGDVTLTLTSDIYETASIHSHRFSNYGFIDGQKMVVGGSTSYSNVVNGHINKANNKYVLFGYCDDPEDYAVVTFKDLNTSLLGSSTSIPQNTDGDPSYHEVRFSTKSESESDISFCISAPGYVETDVITAGRFSGDIRNYDFSKKVDTGNVLKSGNSYGFSVENPKFSYSFYNNNNYIDFEFSSISGFDNGVVLDAGGNYTMTVHGRNSNLKIFYLQIKFKEGYYPDSWSCTSGEFKEYLGAKRHTEYLWLIPITSETQGDPQITFTAGSNAVCIESIVVKMKDGGAFFDGQ